MSNRILISAAAAVFIGLWTLSLLVPRSTLAEVFGEDQDPIDVAPGAFALVELFTSEGCSSCPPADRVAASIAEHAERNDQPIHVIAFHVDYWDRLGWADRFASPAFSQRQRAYARALRSSRVYTPQMIVNGRAEFVGSDRRRAARELEQTLQRPSTASIRVGAVDLKGSKLTTRIELGADVPTDRLVVRVAVVEDGLVSDVTRGENRGRRLEHAAVARVFTTAPVTGDTPIEVSLELPADMDRRKSAMIVYAQDTGTMRIHAATRRALAKP